MNKKIWIIICCFVVLFSFLGVKKLKKHYKEFIMEYTIASAISERGDDFRKFYVSSGYLSPDAYIAHGGGVGEFTYTNCLEAVLDSLKKGFRFIEIDMIETSDGHILGAHDWKHFRSLAGIKDSSDLPLSLFEAQKLKINGKYNILSGSDISELMKSNTQLVLVTDKIRNYKLLLKEIPYPDRMIVEVFSPQDYNKALKSGIKYPAYCIWNKNNLETAIKFKFPLVTMDAKNFFENDEDIQLVQKLHDSGVTILLFYTSFSDRDKPEFLKKYLGTTISKVYTDTWSPSVLP